ncbi:MAG TPA: MerR family transcriptional regulator [Desulfomonilia bacterium]|nr:MerR family transcriptional regulator [Desulfomonilia bacterium]
MKHYPTHMKMSELSARAKKPAATIRYYARQGLLPEPVKTGKTMAYYTVEHLERLNQIHALQKKGHSLAEISRMVNQNPREPQSHLKPDMVYTSKRDVIVRAAVELFRDKGYDTTNIDDIVTRAGIGKGTFYQYFKSKEDLFFECAGHVFYDIARDEPVISEEQDGMKRLWNRAHSFTKTQLHMIDMLNLARGASISHSKRSGQMIEAVMHNLIDPIKADLLMAAEQGKIHFKDLHVLAYLLMGAVEYAYYYLQIHPDSDIDSVLMKGWDMIYGGEGS